ncbi:MAG: hypothetical protein CVV50_03810 [Spirochaetae bacterium HGW-Spirochaetae-6]|nr:MAG: hypothetical protein CVV50_03810 [Spirochaetae bacterium HGW-Spirochaetae-6]
MNIPSHWQEIENIFSQLPRYNCFVCSPSHHSGFRLKFYQDSRENMVASPLKPIDELYCGFPEIVHGGFQAMFLDEIMFWAVFGQKNKITVTANMQMDFIKAVPSNQELLVKGRVVKGSRKIFKAEAFLEDGEGTLLARGSGTYVIPDPLDFASRLGVKELPPLFAVLF